MKKNVESKMCDVEKYLILTFFPQRLQPIWKVNQNSKIFEVFKQVKVNIPLLDAIKQVPFYDKFLKDLCTVKRKLIVQNKAFLTENISPTIQHNTPLKCKDLLCLTISCVIRNFRIKCALFDLGPSVNLLPYSVYEQLGLVELKSISITLQLAYHSMKMSRGIVGICLSK